MSMQMYKCFWAFIIACTSCVRVEPSNGRVLCDDAAYTPLYMDENYLLSELPIKEIEKIKQNSSSWIRKNADNISVLDTLSNDANPTLIFFEMQ